MNDFLEDNVEQEIYSRMCRACPNSKRCHEECETCEGYDRAVKQALGNLKGDKRFYVKK